MSKKYICPVCGFDELKETPYGKDRDPSFEVCPCCSFEFGFDGENNLEIFDEFRKHWIEDGAPWFVSKLKPKGWDYRKQLENLK
ncbi:MAG: hypothetical protein WCH62_01055 [Candidatus Omnitrophota bacterium]